MQDKIPDALIDAFERHYAFPWDEPTLRNERLAWRAAWAEATKPCLHQIQEPSSVSNAETPKVAPAAVAVPDGWKLVPTEPTPQMCHVGRYGGSKDAPAYGEKSVEGETAWPFVADHTAEQIYRAMLSAAPAIAATPAADIGNPITGTAAPVVLPEPVGMATQHSIEEFFSAAHFDARKVPDGTNLYTEQQLRALLAGVSAPAAQTYMDSTPQLHVGDSSFEGWYANYVKEGTVSLKQNCRDAYAAGMGDPLVVAAPQAQADARDAATAAQMVTVGPMGLDLLIAEIRKLPTVLASEIDGEESDGTPRHWRNRPFVSQRQIERLLREFFAPPPSEAA